MTEVTINQEAGVKRMSVGWQVAIITAIYIGLAAFEIAANFSITGVLGDLFSLVLMILLGRTIYGMGEKNLVRMYWVFFVVAAVGGLVIAKITGLLDSGSLSALLLPSVASLLFWLVFGWYWLRNVTLPARGRAITWGITIYATGISLLLIAYYWCAWAWLQSAP